MTLQVVEALRKLGRLGGHLDTRDPRPLSTIGRLDATNVLLGLRHAAQLWWLMGGRSETTVYLPISQGKWGFLRDAVLVGVTRLRGGRVILHLHGGCLQNFYRSCRRPMRSLIRAVCRQAEQAWALTPCLESEFDGLVEPTRVRCVENVVPDLKARSSAVAREVEGLRLLYLSNLLPEKGCFELLAVLGELGDTASDWQVRLVGGGSPEVVRQLRNEIANLGDDGASVRLMGELRGVNRDAQYRWADVFVYPTHYPLEGQPLVVIEALAAGLPVISTRHAGIPETARDGVEGLLVESGDRAGLAAALTRLGSDSEMRRKLGRAARARYESQYSPPRLMEDLRALFA